MKTETQSEYVNRNASNAMQWLTDRSANCPPDIHLDLDAVKLMLREYLDGTSGVKFYSKLGNRQRDEARALLIGFIRGAKFGLR